MNQNKKRTLLLGFVFLFFLVLAYIENTSFFVYIGEIFTNPPLAIVFVFIHNVLAVSLIILGMAFYVEFVLSFLPERKFERVVLQHPRIFALVFTAIIFSISVLRSSNLLRGQVVVGTLALIVLVSLPNGILEGYGIFQCIQKTLKRSLTMKDLALIYAIFLLAAVIEVGFIQALLWISSH